MKKVTLSDISLRTGYSVNTVSHALNDKSDISEKTKKLIRDVASELGYIGNSSASFLRSGKSKSVALIVSDISNPSDGSDCFYFTADYDDGSGEINVLILPEETKNYYLYVDSSNLDELTVEYSGNSMTQNIDDEHYILDLGMCGANEAVTLRFTVKEGVTDGYADFMLRSVNMDKFIKGYKKLKTQSMSVKEFTDTKISGTVTANESGVLYTSIPYDTGWKVTVDGQVLDKEELIALGDALLGINLKKGTHTVEFEYTPQGLKIGIGLTVIGVLILLLYIFVIRKRKFARKFVMQFDSEQEPILSNAYREEIDRQNAEILLREISEKLEPVSEEISEENE